MAPIHDHRSSGRLVAPLNDSTRGSHVESPSRIRGHPRMTSDDVLDIAYGIPTLQPPPDPRRPTNSTSPGHGHTRSASHPFTALFSNRSKNPAIRSGHAETAENGNVSSNRDSHQPFTGRNGQVLEKDLTQGKCMTCNSDVRWPKQLHVFRCTICQTINDIHPTKHGHDSEAVPLSVHRTRKIIEKCILSYLQYWRQQSHKTRKPPSPVLTEPQILIRQTGPHIEIKPLSEGKHAVIERKPVPAKAQVVQPELATNQTTAPKEIHEYEVWSQSGTDKLDSTFEPSPPAFAVAGVTSYAEWASKNGEECQESDGHKKIFKVLEDYIIVSFQRRECINLSFTTSRPSGPIKSSSQQSSQLPHRPIEPRTKSNDDAYSALDHKTLMLGSLAENGSWWTGNESSMKDNGQSATHRNHADTSWSSTLVSSRSPKIDWNAVSEWYELIIEAGSTWQALFSEIMSRENDDTPQAYSEQLQQLSAIFAAAQRHIQRVLLKATETLLKRPGKQLRDPKDVRFLLILLSNPLLYPGYSSKSREARPGSNEQSTSPGRRLPTPISRAFTRNTRGREAVQAQAPGMTPAASRLDASMESGPGQHSGIIKRILGLLSNLNDECHRVLISWFSHWSETQFRRTTDLIGSFVSYRLSRQHGRKVRGTQDLSGGLVPTMSTMEQGSSAALHAALGAAGNTSKKDAIKKAVVYQDDWQVRAAARVMLLFSLANNNAPAHKIADRRSDPDDLSHEVSTEARERAHRHGQILATSDFYNTLLDYSDYIADYEMWESRGTSKFTFCQYPFFLSIGTKIKILEHDAKRQQEVKAREAFFDSIMTHKELSGQLTLHIRRDCLVEDSLRGVSEVVGSSNDEIKKRLKIVFAGESGLDAGGLRKEWFLLLIREVFNPEHGMFIYDEDSHFCYFNPNSFETTDQFFLVGVVLGLAIYNSTILDIALPPFAFKKLLAAAPGKASGTIARLRSSAPYTLEDLAEWRPALANGLKQLLEYDGDVESTFCRDFVADVERYGQILQVPLCPNGESRPVTNANRKEFVSLYIKYMLDTAVVRQFEPFKRGFWQVCAGNALSLFQPEEIELLVRGSEEALDIDTMRAVAIYTNWPKASMEQCTGWFWQTFEEANPTRQRKLLQFITGSDRIPATGAANLVLKITCAGDKTERYPVARTCFNQLMLPTYASLDTLQTMLWTAVYESEGFGLK